MALSKKKEKGSLVCRWGLEKNCPRALFGGQKKGKKVATRQAFCAQDPGEWWWMPGPRPPEFPNHDPAARIAMLCLMPLLWNPLIVHFLAAGQLYWSCNRSFGTGASRDISSRESFSEPFHFPPLAWTCLLSLRTCIMRVKIGKWEPEKFVLVRPLDLARRKCFTVSWSWRGVGYLRNQVRCRRLCDAVD